jgi:hypothetical protein
VSDALESLEAEVDVRYRRASTVLWRTAGDGLLVLPAGAREPVAVTGAGGALWDVLGSAMTAAEAAATLAARFEVPERDVHVAIAPVLENLRAIGALETESP